MLYYAGSARFCSECAICSRAHCPICWRTRHCGKPPHHPLVRRAPASKIEIAAKTAISLVCYYAPICSNAPMRTLAPATNPAISPAKPARTAMLTARRNLPIQGHTSFQRLQRQEFRQKIGNDTGNEIGFRSGHIAGHVLVTAPATVRPHLQQSTGIPSYQLPVHELGAKLPASHWPLAGLCGSPHAWFQPAATHRNISGKNSGKKPATSPAMKPATTPATCPAARRATHSTRRGDAIAAHLARVKNEKTSKLRSWLTCITARMGQAARGRFMVQSTQVSRSPPFPPFHLVLGTHIAR
jgi:hypothetical protein